VAQRVEHRISGSRKGRRSGSASPWLVVSAVAAGLVLVLAVAMYVYDRSRRDTIAKGVTIAGLDVGGLSESAALRKVRREVVAPLNHPVRVHVKGHTWRLHPRAAKLTVDARSMVAQAVRASREGSIVTRTFNGLFGVTVHKEVPLEATYSHAAIRALTAKVRASLNRPPQDATVAVSSGGLTKVPAKVGVTVESGRLGARLERALTGMTPSRTVVVPTKTLEPKVTTAQLAQRYPAYIVIDRSAFQLRFYSHLKLADSYEIAVGMEGLETPAGLHHIEWKQVDPPWYVPDKAWAGSLAGTVVPPGPADPLKARFMSFDGGAGIHGIDPSEYGTIGHDASHGCVRMRIPDVIALYSRTPVGTPVYIL
jgi:lipoprotein-anchoring transpeptidase ErfK/SrfK